MLFISPRGLLNFRLRHGVVRLNDSEPGPGGHDNQVPRMPVSNLKSTTAAFPVSTPRAPTRTGPAIPDIPLQPPRTRGSAPGTDPRALGPMRRPAMTYPCVPPFDPPGLYPRAKNVHGLDDPGITSRSYRTPGPHIMPLTPSRAAHPAFNAQPGR